MAGDLTAWKDACTRLRATLAKQKHGHLMLTEQEIEAFIMMRRILTRKPLLHTLVSRMVGTAAREYARDLKEVTQMLMAES